MTRVYIFSYSMDTPLAMAAARCVRRWLPDATVTVADDGHSPAPDEAVSAIRELGAGYVRTYWPRRGNLNGAACVRGILATLLDGAQDGDVVIKLDADTALRSDGPVRRMLAAGADGFGSCFSSRAFCGLCYGFTGEALRRLIERADEADISDDEPEDMAVGRLALAAGLRLHLELPWSASRPDARWTAYRWPTMPPVERYDQFDIITLGTMTGRQRMDRAAMVDVFDQLADREVTHG